MIKTMHGLSSLRAGLLGAELLEFRCESFKCQTHLTLRVFFLKQKPSPVLPNTPLKDVTLYIYCTFYLFLVTVMEAS